MQKQPTKDKVSFYDGKFYFRYLDPILVLHRRAIHQLIEPGSSLIDIACGTGTTIFKLAPKLKRGVGVDISSSMHRFAVLRNRKLQFKNIEFYHQDSTNLAMFRDKEFDYSLVSLALHEMSPADRPKIIGEMKRVSKKIIIADYTTPLPKNPFGLAGYAAEYWAGSEHYQNYLNFQAEGGIKSLAEKNGLKEIKRIKNSFSLFMVVVFEPED